MGTWNDVEDKDLVKEIEAVEKNKGNGSREQVPFGTYEVAVTKMIPSKSKSNKDMLTIWFKVIAGRYKNSVIFCHQTLVSAFAIHKANEILRGLTQDMPEFKIAYSNRARYEDLIMEVFEAIEGKYEYSVEYGETTKGFLTFTIKEVFPLD